MYENYQAFIKESLETCGLENINFKSNPNYTDILEHVSFQQGYEYINHIKNVFPNILFDNILEFVAINDKYGYPKKYEFTFSDGQLLNCSPTSIRYVFHSLIILQHYKNKQACKNVVEVGCGYGGLFLAICYFSKLLDINIDSYSFIDLPEICGLIKKYLEMHKDIIHIDYSIHSAYNYGSDVDKQNLFLISNYCFTEISNEHRNKYIETLFPKISNGFILWQTCLNCPIENVGLINNNQKHIEEEVPQTSPLELSKNYFVYF
jgi:hypothetical protein